VRISAINGVKFFLSMTIFLATIIGGIIIYIYQFNIKNPMIWDVSKNDKHFYLGASSHRLPPNNVPKSYFDILDKVNKFYMEASADCSSTYSELFENSTNQYFTNRFSKKQTQYLQEFFRKYGGGSDINTYTTPAILSSMYSNFDNYYGWTGEFGIETSLMNHLNFTNRQKEVFAGGLEGQDFCDTYNTYFKEVANHPELYFKLGSIEATPAVMTAKLKAWRAGDFENLIALSQLTAIDNEYANVRNRKWINKINEIIKDEHYKLSFIVVGAAHFPGENGMLSLLGQQGYSIKRLDVGDEWQENYVYYLSGWSLKLFNALSFTMLGALFLFLIFSVYIGLIKLKVIKN